MDLFRKIKKTTSAPCTDSEMEHDSEEIASSNSYNDAVVANDKINSIDDLLESDEECAEIFDDDNEDDYPQTPSKAVNVSISSSISPKSFQEVVQSLGGGLSLQQNNGAESSKHSPSRDDEEEEEETNSIKEDEEEDKGSESAEDYTDDEDEGEDSYKPGGYHPVEVGEVYNQK